MKVAVTKKKSDYKESIQKTISEDRTRGQSCQLTADRRLEKCCLVL